MTYGEDDCIDSRDYEIPVPYGWMQFKGMEICMDLNCECGELGHIDAEFANHVVCAYCGREYVMAGFMPLIPYTGQCKWHEPKEASK